MVVPGEQGVEPCACRVIPAGMPSAQGALRADKPLAVKRTGIKIGKWKWKRLDGATEPLVPAEARRSVEGADPLGDLGHADFIPLCGF